VPTNKNDARLKTHKVAITMINHNSSVWMDLEMVTYLNMPIILSCSLRSFCSDGQSGQVRSGTYLWGLEVGVVYKEAEGKLHFSGYYCEDGATFNLLSMNGEDISASGCTRLGFGQVKDERNGDQAVMNGKKLDIGAAPIPSSAHEGSLGQISTSTTGLIGSLGKWAPCKSSDQCQSGCCSGQYSEDMLKCTPLDSVGHSSDICVGSAPGNRYLRVGKEWN